MIRNITILLLLILGLAQGQLHHFVEIDQPQLRGTGPCITKQQREQLQSHIKTNRKILIENGSINTIPKQERVLFSHPLQASDDYNSFGNYIIFNYVNQNPENPNDLKDWNCGDRTYHNGCNDEYYCSHRGTDYTLFPFCWNMMENNSVNVIAVAEGIILQKYDSEVDDICGLDYPDGLPDDLNSEWNYIVIEHYDGTIAIYGHLRTDSIPDSLENGDTVYVGEKLGVVGSSGMSWEPHLHFEIWDNTWNGDWIEGDIEASLDPFYGDCNESNDSSLWLNQKPYYDSKILRIITHSSPPEWYDCEPSILNIREVFSPGDIMYIGAYYRDHFFGQTSEWRIYNQDGDIFDSWPYTFYDSEYEEQTSNMYSLSLPSDTLSMGTWTIEIEYEGQIYEQLFNVDYAPYLALSNDVEIIDFIGDHDMIANPGEEIHIFTDINNVGNYESINIQGSIECENNSIYISSSEFFYSTISSGETISNVDQPFIILIPEDMDLVGIDCSINLTYLSDVGFEYETFSYFTFSVSLNQFGFPYQDTGQIVSTPLVIDLDQDGDNEIIFGDQAPDGVVHVLNDDGSEVISDIFPYTTENKIWGSPSAADLDNDGEIEFVISSQDKNLYIFSSNSLEIVYNTASFLLGTPAIGNIDDDEDLEIIFGGYSSSNDNLFAINHDGTDVETFPLNIGEKIRRGVALADFNSNGRDDIVFGTDSDHIYLIYDDGNTASGFPFETDSKIWSDPSILDMDGEKIIFAGSYDGTFYAINGDGSLRFSISAGDGIVTSPSFTTINDIPYIFFGSKDGYVYAVDTDGNSLAGWPIYVGGWINSSIAFSDLDNDQIVEIVVANNMGKLSCYNIDGILYPHFPINYNSEFTSSITINDVDMDGDLEILAGNSNSIVVVDIKDITNTDNSNYWYTYRGNNQRSGYLAIESDQLLGDINGDEILNVLDVVIIANMLLANDYNTITDMNEDGTLNVLDLVILVNIILGN